MTGHSFPSTPTTCQGPGDLASSDVLWPKRRVIPTGAPHRQPLVYLPLVHQSRLKVRDRRTLVPSLTPQVHGSLRRPPRQNPSSTESPPTTWGRVRRTRRERTRSSYSCSHGTQPCRPSSRRHCRREPGRWTGRTGEARPSRGPLGRGDGRVGPVGPSAGGGG